MLTFVEARTFGSLYRAEDGRLTIRPHGELHRYELDEDVLDHFWCQWLNRGGRRYDEDGFLAFLAPKLRSDDLEDTISWCDYDYHPFLGDDHETLASGEPVCDGHRIHYWQCDDCQTLWSSTTTVGAWEVCEDCLTNYTWCDSCTEYYDPDADTTHSHDCECESHELVFSFPNGDGTISQDERVTIGMPAGVISAEGMISIQLAIHRHAYRHTTDGQDRTAEQVIELEAARTKLVSLSYDFEDVGNEWQGKRGNFPKRLSRFAHTKYGLKLDPALVSEIGNIARAHSNGKDVQVEVTRDLNMPAEDFYHEDSCWWQSYSEGRCALKTNGGIGLRTFGKDDDVTGRAWVMPLKRDAGKLTPTYDATNAVAYVVINGYGDLEGYAAARIVAQMVGGTYRKIGFSCSPMWVNGDTGYLVGAEDVVSPYTDGSLSLYVSQHSNLGRQERQERELVTA